MTLSDALSSKRGVDIAAAAGVHPVTICAWKRGASLPPRTRIPALAAALGMDADRLTAMVARARTARLVGKTHRRLSCPKYSRAAGRKGGRA